MYNITKRLRYALLPVTVTLTLHTDVITQKGTEDEVLLGRELVQRTGHHKPYGIKALTSAKEEVNIVALQRRDDIVYTLTLQTFNGITHVSLVEGVEHHAAHALLTLIEMVKQYTHGS